MLKQASDGGILLTKGLMSSTAEGFGHHPQFNVTHATGADLPGFLQRFTQGDSQL